MNDNKEYKSGVISFMNSLIDMCEIREAACMKCPFSRIEHGTLNGCEIILKANKIVENNES